MKVSKTGYKKNSKDKNQPFLLIPSNQITMKGVEFPVFGVDDTGYSQMMYPGMDYSFPGNYVYEKPMKNKLKRYQKGGTPKTMTWTEYLDALGIKDTKLRSIDPKSKLYSETTGKLGEGDDFAYDLYNNASVLRPHSSDILEDTDNLKAARVIDMYNALFWNRGKQDYSGTDRHEYSDTPSDRVALELNGYKDNSIPKEDALDYIKNFYNSSAADILPKTFNHEDLGSTSRNVKDVPIEYTQTSPRSDLMVYSNPNWERDNPLFQEDKSMDVFGQYHSMPLNENFYEDWNYRDPNSERTRLEFQAFPKPAYNYKNVPKRYDEKGNEVVSKYDVPNPQANTYYDFPGSLTEDIYNQKNMLHDIYIKNVANLKKFDPNAYPSVTSDRNLLREYVEKEYASDPYLFYGDQNSEDRYCTHCEKLSGSEHTTDRNIDFFKFKPQYPSSKLWLMKTFGLKPPRPIFLSQPNATSTGQVQIGWDIWDPKQQQWKAQHFDTEEINRRREEVKVPKDGGREIKFKDSVIHDLKPYSLPDDVKPGTVIDTNNKPVIRERKVVQAPTFQSGGWLDTYDKMTPSWSKNPEGNWVVKAQKGLQYTAKPTRADSLELLKNSRLVQNYYNSQNYNKISSIPFDSKNSKEYALELLDEDHNTWDANVPRTTPGGISQRVSLDQYYKPVDKNKFYQREYAHGILDTRAPMQLYDRRILPTIQYTYENVTPNDPLKGDNVGLFGYDPISITPWDMLTDKQKKIRVKKFGRDSVPEDYDPDRPATPAKIEPLPIKLLEAPQDRLVREYNAIVPNENYRKTYDKSPYSLKEYGPEGKFTHWAKADEKIPGVWRPVKGTPSDLFINKRVKFQEGGKTAPTIVNDPTAGRSYYDPIGQVVTIGTLPFGVKPEHVREHELFHHLQNINNDLHFGTPVKRPAITSTEENAADYFNRKNYEIGNIIDAFNYYNPSFQFVPNQVIYDKYADNVQYDFPWTVEGEAQNYENYIKSGGKSIFKSGGQLNKYQVGSSVLTNTFLPAAQAITSYLNPYNWGVEDYSQYKTFSEAFTAARKSGQKEFMWNGNRYNTRKDMDPIKFVNDDPRGEEINRMLRTEYPELLKYLNKGNNVNSMEFKGVPENALFHKKANPNRASYDPGTRTINIGENHKYFDDNLNDIIAEAAHLKDPKLRPFNRIFNYTDDTFKHLFIGEDIYDTPGHMEYNTHRLYEPGIRIMAYNNLSPTDIKRIQRFLKVKDDGYFGEETYKALRDKYKDHPDVKKWEEVSRKSYNDTQPDLISPPINVYLEVLNEDLPLKHLSGSHYFDDYQAKGYAQINNKLTPLIYTDKALLENSAEDMNPKLLQEALVARGYKLPKSTKKDGSLDGKLGDETRVALLDYQSKNKIRPYRGNYVPKNKETKKTVFKSGGWLEQYQKKGEVHQKTYTDPDKFAKANKAYNDSLDLYTKSVDFHNKHIPMDNYDTFGVPYDDVHWTADAPGGYFIDHPFWSKGQRIFLGKHVPFSLPGTEANKIFTESFANKIKPIGFDTVDWPYPVYKKPTEEPVYEQLKNLTPLDARFQLPEVKLNIGKPAVKSQGIRMRPIMTADQNTKTGQYQTGKYMWDPETKSWKVKMFSPETQQENRQEVKIGLQNGGWLDKYQDAGSVRRDPNQPFFPSATEQDMYESQYSQPEVTITPDWTEAELERNRLRDAYIKKDKNIFRHWYDKLGYDKDNVTKRANQFAYNKLAKKYLKGDKENLTPEQRKFIEKSEYANRLQPSVGSRFVEGITNPGFNMETVANVLAPFEYPGNLVRGAVTGEFADALKGQTPSPYFVSSDLAGISPTEAAIASGLMTVGTDPLFLTGDEVFQGVGKGASGLRKFFRKPGVTPKVPSKSLNEIAADVDALNATIKPRSEATTEDMQSLLEKLQGINRSLEEHIDPSKLDDMSFDPSITDDISSVDPDIFRSMKDRLKGLERNIQNDELARDRKMDEIINREVPEEFAIEARRAGAKGPQQTGFFTDAEINDKIAQYKDYQNKLKYFDEMYPPDMGDMFFDIISGGTGRQDREELFQTLFPNAKKPDWFGKEYLPKDREYLSKKLKYEPDTPFHKWADKTSDAGLKGLLDFEKKTNSQLPFQKYISDIEKDMADPTSWYNTNPRDFVMEFRGSLDLDPKYIKNLSEQELRELAEDIQIARMRRYKEDIIEHLNQKGPKPDKSLSPERLNKYGGFIKGLNKYQDGGDYDKISKSWKDQYDWTPNVEEEYQQFKNNPNAPENLRFTDDMNDYNTRGMWDSLDRPSDWQQALDLFKQQQGYEWTPEEDGYYHAWSQHPGTGEWLKPKHHSTGWMNYMGYAFDPNTTAVVNPEGFFGNETLQAYPKKKKGGVKSSAEGYYDYINGYSGIFAKGGTKGWLDNYK